MVGEDVRLRDVAFIAEHADAFPGITVEERSQREYPYGALAAHVLGYTSMATPESLENQAAGRDVLAIDTIGSAGVEATYDAYLSGEHGESQVMVDANGRRISVMSDIKDTKGNDLYLTLDARYNYIAYEALAGRKGAVGVYNYETGEVLCMVSTPAFDPLYPPSAEEMEGNDAYDGVYLNRFLSSAYVPGSVFKTVTLTAALENLPDAETRTWNCTGSVQIGDETITCSGVHGEQTLKEAFAHSCNAAFAQIAEELGADTLRRYTEKAGLTSTYSVDGLPTAKGTFNWDGITAGQLGWAGVGQYHDQVNPCAFLLWMGAIANGGKAAEPYLIRKTVSSLGIPSLPHITQHTGQLIDSRTAATVADFMANNVTETYGTKRFPNMELCAKSGTAEVGTGQTPHAWFAGFLRNEDAPYAFVVLVENGGGGNAVAGTVAGKVLNVIVNGY